MVNSNLTPTEVTIGGRLYRLSVPPAQAAHLRALALRVDAIVAELKAADAFMDRDQQLMLTCLQLAGDLHKAQTDLDETVSATGRLHRQLAERLEILLPK